MAAKSQRWVVDSGILRKKAGDEEAQELLVFGYSCKLFRDDERAKLIDQGKHLIPWMGDSTLKIDRYDGRGALGDLRIYEPPPGGIDHRTILTEDEYKIEQACDEERYRSLYNNDAEESLHHEEEIKRLHQALDSDSSYSQVGFNYDEEKKSGEDSQSPKPSEGSEEDEVFVRDPVLEIPEDMIVPEKQKLNAIITKTALFISLQGSQMEILIKAKQSNNPQFSFLSIDGELHPYYKHVLEAIKSGKYNPEKQPEKEESEPEEESEEEDDEPYLHPSLVSSLKVESAPNIPSINYKPSADCTYSMLVNKITGKPPSSKTQPAEPEVIPPPPMPPIGFFPPMHQGYPPYTMTPQQYSHGPVLYSANGNAIPTTPGQQSMPQAGPTPLMPGTNVQTPHKEPTPLVPYGPTPPKPLSRPSFIVPPADVQIIIDKMASYVAKNGRDFESIVKSKGDPRFNFLELSHQYHGYYAHKLTMYEGAVNPRVLTEEDLLQKQELQEEKQKKLEELQKKQQRMEEVQKRVKMIQAKKKGEIGANARQSPSKQITTVSFSIKKPKEGESTVIEKRNALPLEESDDEVSEEKKEGNSKADSPPPIVEEEPPVKVEKELIHFYPEKRVTSSPEKKPAKPTRAAKPAKPTKPEPTTTHNDGDFVDLTDDIFEDCQKEVRTRQTEDRIRNKMAAAAREKLAASREKQLQMERRKKAAMFLSQIQAPTIVKQPEREPPAAPVIRKEREPPAAPVIRKEREPPAAPVIRKEREPPAAPVMRKEREQSAAPVMRKEREPPAAPVIRKEREPPAAPIIRKEREPPAAPVIRKEREPPAAPVMRKEPTPPSFPSPTRGDIEIEELRINTNSLMSRLRGADLNNKRSRQRSRSRSGSVGYSDRSGHRSHKKHKKKKSSHKSSYRESVSSSSSRSHKSKKSKKSSSRHRSRSRSPHKHHSSSSRYRKESSSSDSDSDSS